MENCVNLLIFGAGGYGQVVKELALQMGEFNRIEFLDDNSSLAIGKISDGGKFVKDFPYAVIAIGNPDIRERVFKEIEKSGFKIVNIISDKSNISLSAKMGKGCIIEHNVTISANCVIGNSVFLCASSVVGHNSVVNDFCQIDYNGVISVGSEVPAKTKVIAGSVYRNQA